MTTLGSLSAPATSLGLLIAKIWRRANRTEATLLRTLILTILISHFLDASITYLDQSNRWLGVIGTLFGAPGFVSFIVICFYPRSNRPALLALLVSTVANGLGVLSTANDPEKVLIDSLAQLITYLIVLVIIIAYKRIRTRGESQSIHFR